MSSNEQQPDNDRTPQGPCLALLYSLVGLALLVAVGVAVLIVLPFYNRR
jgi:hypothetical protein